jgi:hypothetical protein
MWRGYNFLQKDNFAHLKANHSVNSVDLFNKLIHTNTIERAWRSLKENIPKSIKASEYSEYVQAYLVEKELAKNQK